MCHAWTRRRWNHAARRYAPLSMLLHFALIIAARRRSVFLFISLLLPTALFETDKKLESPPWRLSKLHKRRHTGIRCCYFFFTSFLFSLSFLSLRSFSLLLFYYPFFPLSSAVVPSIFIVSLFSSFLAFTLPKPSFLSCYTPSFTASASFRNTYVIILVIWLCMCTDCHIEHIFLCTLSNRMHARVACV